MLGSRGETFGLLALDVGAERRGEAGLKFRREHVLLWLLLWLLSLCAESGQAVVGQRELSRGRKLQVTRNSFCTNSSDIASCPGTSVWATGCIAKSHFSRRSADATIRPP
jgi:hypothetical protein